MTEQPAEQSARTTLDNSVTSSDTADNPLREQIMRAMIRVLAPSRHLLTPEEFRIVDEFTAAALTAVRQHLDIGEEHAWCKTCRRVWDGPQHRCESDAEQTVARVTALHEQWVKAGPPSLGTPVARWWDRRLVEHHHAIRPARHDDGPTVREAAADDRRWDAERAGE